MPLYEYHCSHCGKNFEIQHKMADPAPLFGPDCTETCCKMERQISRVAAVVKSPNPMARAAQQLQNLGAADSKPEPKSHQCGSGCALHSR